MCLYSWFQQTLPQFWKKRGLINILLLPLSLLFYGLIKLRQYLYQTHLLTSSNLSVPVIVVGNLVVGGSGKTPFVFWLFQALKAAGKKPGIISRGYGRTDQRPLLVDLNTPVTLGGDEPCLLAKLTEQVVAVGSDRIAAAQLLLASHPECDILISDDGLQHHRLSRQFEIIVFDKLSMGNGWLLPAGPLREPHKRLYQVDALIWNGPMNALASIFHNQHLAQLPPCFQMELQPTSAYQLNFPNNQYDLITLAEKYKTHKILAAAGIGHPTRFFVLLEKYGIQAETLALPDHYNFSINPFVDHLAELILITEKDAVKCIRFNDPRIWVVPVLAKTISLNMNLDLISIILGKIYGSTTA